MLLCLKIKYQNVPLSVKNHDTVACVGGPYYFTFHFGRPRFPGEEMKTEKNCPEKNIVKNLVPENLAWENF